MFKKTDQKTWDDYWLPPEKLIENKPEGNDLPFENFPLLYKTILKNSSKLYNGGTRELKTVSKKVAGQFLEHDKSRKSQVPFPNIPNIANRQHPIYEIDIKWDVREIPLNGTQYLLVLYDKARQVHVYFLVSMSSEDHSIYKFQKTEDKEQYIFYPDPKETFLFAITEADEEKLGVRKIGRAHV